MTGTLNVPDTPGGSFLHATASGNITVDAVGFVGAAFAIYVDGTGTGSLASPTTALSTYNSNSGNTYTSVSWSVDGLWQTPQLTKGASHTIALYVQNCGITFKVGKFTGATLTGMVLNQ
jgi:hypothetical protein